MPNQRACYYPPHWQGGGGKWRRGVLRLVVYLLTGEVRPLTTKKTLDDDIDK